MGIELRSAGATERPLGPFQAASDLGLRLPDLAAAGHPFTVEAVDAEPAAMCLVHEVDDGDRLAAMQLHVPSGDVLDTEVLPSGPGIYRFGDRRRVQPPVERLLLVGEPG